MRFSVLLRGRSSFVRPQIDQGCQAMLVGKTREPLVAQTATRAPPNHATHAVSSITTRARTARLRRELSAQFPQTTLRPLIPVFLIFIRVLYPRPAFVFDAGAKFDVVR